MFYDINFKFCSNSFSFEHFGTQPHWNNPKVQWWYGDASKSLLTLPSTYFSSFDLVLVDLSETIMSVSVTKHLDILSALGLLLNENGIFVKNELYLNKLSQVFEHTLQLHYYDVPVICSQALILGSNGIDFIRGEMHNHDIEVVWGDLLGNKDIWHDYRHNASYAKVCLEDEGLMEQEKSPGILMILDVEGVQLELEGITSVIDAVLSSLKLNKLSSLTYPLSNISIITTFFKQGYVIARYYQYYNYIAFDIHLWSAFDKLSTLKLELQSKLKSSKVSSYRIVAGGVFGMEDWKEDERNRGPNFYNSCQDTVLMEQDTEDDVMDTILDKSLDLMDKMNVLVICDQDCSILDTIKSHSNVQTVIPLYPCLKDLQTCQVEVSKLLKQYFNHETLFKVLTNDDVLNVGDRVMARITAKTSYRAATIQKIHPNGTFYITFDNGYGASVVRSEFTYGGREGLYELAVFGKDGHISYDTPITNDVLGYLKEEEVTKILEQIQLLK